MADLDDALKQIDQQIADMEAAEVRMAAQGLSLAEYNLGTEMAVEKQQREIREAEALQQKEQGLLGEEETIASTGQIGSAAPTTTINKKVVKPGAGTSFTPSKALVGNDIEETGPGWEVRKSRLSTIVPVKDILSPEEMYKSAQERMGKTIDQQEYGDARPFEKGMEGKSQMLEAYKKKYGEYPEEVYQYKDYSEMVGGKPTSELYPVPPIEHVLAGAPHKKDFVGDLNYLRNWSNAMKEFSKRSGIAMEDIEKTDYYRVLAAENPKESSLLPQYRNRKANP